MSLLHVFEKTFEKLTFKSLFEYLDEHKLLSEHQSGFRPNDSYTNQLLPIVHDIYTDFDADSTLEVWVVLLDMSKAFDKVWHQGLIYKLGPVGISGEALAFISSYFNNRFHYIILTGQSSNRLPVKVGVLQGSTLGSLFFLVYVNDLTSLFSVANDANISTNELHKDLELISEWAYKKKMSFTPYKNKQAQEVVFSRKQPKPKHSQPLFNKTPVACSSSQKHLEIILDEKLSFTNHTEEKIQKAGIKINVIESLNNILPQQGSP